MGTLSRCVQQSRRVALSKREGVCEAVGCWSENILDYFLRNRQITRGDGAEITWYHGANHRAQLEEALSSAAHMVEADVLLASVGAECGQPVMAHPPDTHSDTTLQAWLAELQRSDKGIKLDFKRKEFGQPVMAHPPDTHSDTTLQAWLAELQRSDKGIKLDFKSLAAVEPAMVLLDAVRGHWQRPVWINADVLPGPSGSSSVVDAKPFIDTVTSFFPAVTLSLGWTTGWHPENANEGYSWAMVREMEFICDGLSQPVTFPVRAALVRQSCPQLLWLLKRSDRYSLTIWTGKGDNYSTEDLLYIRDHFDKKQVFYDISEPQNREFKQAIGITVNL
ncbi:Protein FAM151B [Fukomys damarensis]|uniref:Protein FAM151B n=1 Tax=Fukomys damarensis TaxID=885580 RepID=A0A091E1S3_FUKDA|nr:Protein FAM151B [Fukomys damarensis]